MDEQSSSDIDSKLTKHETLLGNLTKKIKTHDFALTTHTVYIVANTVAIVVKFMMSPLRR